MVESTAVEHGLGDFSAGDSLGGLPPSVRVDVSALAAIFRHTTNSYKYLLFMGLLDILEQRQFGSQAIDFDAALEAMVRRAWYPSVLFRLSFGSQDHLSAALDAFRGTGAARIRAGDVRGIARLPEAQSLLRYVPTRLIRPFFADRLKGLSDAVVDSRIENYSYELFGDRKPLYAISTPSRMVTFHPEWVAYLRDNLAIVRSWALWEWYSFVQARNPSVPNIGSKLGISVARTNLAFPRTVWNIAVAADHERRLRCIYSGEPLRTLKTFEIDHFVPWAFVSHDQPWNLIAVSKEANSRKSDSVPAAAYVDGLSEVQFHALRLAKPKLSPKEWDAYAATFIETMDLDDTSIADETRFRERYRERVPPLLSLAKTNGFEAEWRWSG